MGNILGVREISAQSTRPSSPEKILGDSSISEHEDRSLVDTTSEGCPGINSNWGSRDVRSQNGDGREDIDGQHFEVLFGGNEYIKE